MPVKIYVGESNAARAKGSVARQASRSGRRSRVYRPRAEDIQPAQMSNYLPHDTKKREVLKREEATLRRLIDSGAKADRLIAQATVVRDARVRVLRAKRATVVPREQYRNHYDRLSQEIEEQRSVMPESILAEFGFA